MKLKLPFYKLRRGISNIIRYFPVIWSDEDYDYEPLYKLLYYKLKFMEDFYRSDKTYSVDALKVADEIKICKNLSKRLYEDNYLTNAFVEHEQRFPDYLSNMCSENMEGQKFARYVNKNSKKEKKNYEKWSKHSDYLEKQDKEYLFSQLVRNVNKWWD